PIRGSWCVSRTGCARTRPGCREATHPPTPSAIPEGAAMTWSWMALTALGALVPETVLTAVVGGSLLLLGAHRLRRHRHPRYGGMRVGFRELTTWSFLMATAHGAGLMVLPLLVGGSGASAQGLSSTHAMHLAHASIVPVSGPMATGLWATV